MPNDPLGEAWTPILSGIVGSHAYGLNHADSDVDRIQIAVAPTEAFLGLRTPVERTLSRQFHNPDIAVHEVGKALRLLLKCNPTITELLWLDSHEVCTEWGADLVDARPWLLTADRVRGAYLGYASQQFQRLLNKGRFPDVPVHQNEKHARHLLRLVEQGTTLWRTGELVLRVDDPQRYFDFGRRVAADPTIARPVLAGAEDAFTRPTVLRQHVNETSAERWLRRIRRAYYTPGAV